MHQTDPQPTDQDSDPIPQVTISRGALTVGQFLDEQGLEGGVELSPEDGRTIVEHPVGDLLGEQRYAVGDAVARGGMGVIYAARDLNCRRIVAIKTMRRGPDAPPQQVLQFIEEAQVTGQLEHPGTVPLHELDVDDHGRLFFSMKMVHGRNLEQILNAIRDGDADTINAFPLSRLITIFQKCADAVAFAHSKGVIHRDLKPENIMVGDYGEVLLMDWGVAKILPGKSATPAPAQPARKRGAPPKIPKSLVSAVAVDKTISGELKGTPAFMAPEQAHGHNDRISPRTDVYALGAILYNILTLHRPIVGATVPEVLLKVARGAIRPPCDYNPTRRQRDASTALLHCPNHLIPESLSAVAMKALANDPAQRYPDVRALQNDIEAWQGGYATSAEDAGTFRLMLLLARRHKVETALLAASAAVLLAIVAAFLIQLTHEKRVALRRAGEARAALAELTQLEGRTVSMQRASCSLMLLKARRLDQAGEGEKALELVARAVETDPGVKPEAAPFFLRRAKHMLDRNDWEGAREAVNLAVEYDTDHRLAEARHLKGRLDISELKVSDAIEALREARTIDPQGVGRKVTRMNLLCLKYRGIGKRQQGRLTINQLVSLGYELRAMGEERLAFRVLNRTRHAAKTLPDKLDIANRMLKILNPGHDSFNFTYREVEGGLAMDVSNNRFLTEITPLNGLPIVDLDLSRTKVSDLAPLKGMQLHALELGYSNAVKLDALAGMPIRRFSIRHCEIDSVDAIAAFPLEHLDIHRTPIHDLRPLQANATLTALDAGHTSIRSLEPLRNAPLETLDLAGCPLLHDLAPIAAIPTIKTLLLPSYPGNLELLRDHPGIGRIDYHRAMPAPEFWARHDAGIHRLRRRLGEANPEYRGEGTFRVDRQGGLQVDLPAEGCQLRDCSPFRDVNLVHFTAPQTPLEDLTPFAGLPLRSLKIPGTAVTTLVPVRDAPLERVDISDTPIRDLAPLAGKTLKELVINRTAISDLSGIDGRKLQRFAAAACPYLADLSLLETAAELSEATIPGHLTGVEFLRRRASLKTLATGTDGDDSDAARFWQKYDQLRRRCDQAIEALRTANPGAERLQSKIAITADLRVDLALNGPVADLAALKPLPLRRLRLASAVAETVPVGEPLQVLFLADCPRLKALVPSGAIKRLRLIALPPHLPAARVGRKLANVAAVTNDPVAAQLHLDLLQRNPAYLCRLQIITRDRKPRAVIGPAPGLRDLTPLGGTPVTRIEFEEPPAASWRPLLACPGLKQLDGLPRPIALDSRERTDYPEALAETRKLLAELRNGPPWARQWAQKIADRIASAYDPVWIDSLLARGHTRAAGRAAEAMADAATKPIDRAAAALAAARILAHRGRLDDAAKWLDRAARERKLPAELNHRITLEKVAVLHGQKRTDAARKLLSRLVDALPASDPARLGYLAAAIGPPELAERLAAATAPPPPDTAGSPESAVPSPPPPDTTVTNPQPPDPPVPSPLPAGCLFYFPFHESHLREGDHPAVTDATLHYPPAAITAGATTEAAGRRCMALHQTHRLAIPNTPAMRRSRNFTIAFRIKAAHGPKPRRHAPVLGMMGEQGWLIRRNDSIPRLEIAIKRHHLWNPEQIATSNVAIDDQWHHVAFVATLEHCHVFLDGIRCSTKNLHEHQRPAGDWREAPIIVGAIGESAAPVHGFIDDIAYFPRPLRAGEVRRLAAMEE